MAYGTGVVIQQQAELIAQLQQQLSGKANASTVQGLSNRLGTVETALPNKAEAAALLAVKQTAETVAGKVDSATTGLAATNTLATTNASGLTAANAAIGNRLRKDQADATAFPLGVPKAQDMSQAVQKSELVGGIQRPYRVFQNVGATPVGAYVRSGQPAQIADTLGLGQAYAITSIRIKSLSAATLASTITLTSGAATVFSTTVALVALPAVGKVVDLLSLVGTSLPADITLPATLLCSASSGTFEVLVDGVLK